MTVTAYAAGSVYRSQTPRAASCVVRFPWRQLETETPSAYVHPKTVPESIDELFGKRVKRSAQSGSTAQSLWIPGPVTSFKRLDFDEDGQLSANDLIELARPLQVPVRIHALIAALDTDGDGTLSEAEFRASMR